MNRTVCRVAQIFNLLYRRVALCLGWASKRLAALARRLADFKPALRQIANLRYQEALSELLKACLKNSYCCPAFRLAYAECRLEPGRRTGNSLKAALQTSAAPPVTHHAPVLRSLGEAESRITSALRTPHSALRTRSGLSTIRHRLSTAFTLLELLVVIGIIALITAIALPTLNKFKPNYAASVTRQLLDALARGRQLAISQRTTVYMIFVPTNSWSDPAFTSGGFQQWISRYTNAVAYTNLLDKQLIGYNYVSLHTVGDQPGRPTVHYLSNWRTLPEGGFIFPAKFMQDYQWFNVYTNLTPPTAVRVYGFSHTNNIPFPNEAAPRGPLRDPYPMVPYIAFDYMGRVVSGNPSSPEIIPLAKGSVTFARGPDRKAVRALPSCTEQPVGNATNATSYTLIYIDRLTGRARVVQPEVR